VLRGRGGWCVDVSRPGYVRDVLAELTTESRARGAEARRHVEATFSHEAVYPQFMEMYRRVVGRVTNDEQASDEYSNAL